MLLTLVAPGAINLADESNVRIPRHADGRPLSTEERIRLVELKLGGALNWAKDPYFGFTVNPAAACANRTALCDDGHGAPHNRGLKPCINGLYDHPICLDDSSMPWNPSPAGVPPGMRPCVVYDFGIRQQPEFGMTLAKHTGCEVHAFDPSPISVTWFKEARQRGSVPRNYHFHPYGAGGIDGNVHLKEYDWGQVSILRLPELVNNCSGVPTDQRVLSARCKFALLPRKDFLLKVHTLSTIMRFLGHTHIDVLKVDVEGSEYAFLEDAADHGVLDKVEQLALEWHHFPFDQRYGAGSSPAINALVTVLAAVGLPLWWVHNEQGWPATDAVYPFANMYDVRYGLASFRRVRRPAQTEMSGAAAGDGTNKRRSAAGANWPSFG